MARSRSVRVLSFLLAIALLLQPVAALAQGPGDYRSVPIVLPSAPPLAFAAIDSTQTETPASEDERASSTSTEESVQTGMASGSDTPVETQEAVQVVTSGAPITKSFWSELDLEEILKSLEVRIADAEKSQAELQAMADAINEQAILVVFRAGTTESEALAAFAACGMVSLGAFGTSGLYLASMKPGGNLEAGLLKLQARPEVVAADSLLAAVNQSGSPAGNPPLPDSDTPAQPEPDEPAPQPEPDEGLADVASNEAELADPPADEPAAEAEGELPASAGNETPADGDAPPVETAEAAVSTESGTGASEDSLEAEVTPEPAVGQGEESIGSDPDQGPATPAVPAEPAVQVPPAEQAAAASAAACTDAIDPEGHVRDAATAQPLRNARITVTSTAGGVTVEAYTNHEGYYSTFVPAGTYLISALLTGYAPSSVTRTVVDQPITVDFALHDATAPRVMSGGSKPLDGSTTGSRPVLGAVFWDEESGVDAATGATMLLDGTDVTALARSTALSIRYQPVDPLSDGTHSVVLTVRDRAGNQTSASWSFTVAGARVGDESPGDFALGGATGVIWDDMGGLCLARHEVVAATSSAIGAEYALSAPPDGEPDPGEAAFTDGSDVTHLGYAMPADTVLVVEVTLDLGSARRLSKAVLATGDGGPDCAADSFEVLVSLDGLSFTLVGSTTLRVGAYMTVLFAAVEARYVRFRVSKAAGTEPAVLHLNEGHLYEAIMEYVASGVFVSRVLDTGAPSDFFTVEWGPLLEPEGTSLRLQVAGLEQPGDPPDWAGPDGTAATYFTPTSVRKLPALLSGKRFLRYRVLFSTTDPDSTPKLSRVSFSYDNRGPPASDDVNVAISSPVTGSLLQGSSIELEGSASDPDGSIIGVFVSGDGGVSWRLATTDGSAWTHSLASNHGGTYQVLATAVGSDFETATAEATTTVTSVPGPPAPHSPSIPPGDPPIHGTDGNDTIRLEWDGSLVKVWVNGALVISHALNPADPVYTIYAYGGNDTITLWSSAAFPSGYSVVVYGGDGNDTIDVSDFTSVSETQLRGQAGNDTYVFDEDFGLGLNFRIYEVAGQGTDTIHFVNFGGTASVAVDASGNVTLSRTAPPRSLTFSASDLMHIERLTGLNLALSSEVLDALTGQVLDDLVAWAANLIASEMLADSYLNKLMPALLANVGVSLGNALDLPGVMETLRTYLRSVIKNNLPDDPTLSDMVSAINSALGVMKTLVRYGAGVVGDRLITNTLLSDPTLGGTMSFAVQFTWIPDSAKPSVTQTLTRNISISLVGANVGNLATRIQAQFDGTSIADGKVLGSLIRAKLTADGGLVIDVNSMSVKALRVTPSNDTARTLFGFSGQRIANLANRVNFPDDPTTSADDRLNQLGIQLSVAPYVSFVSGQIAIGLALGASGTAATQFAIDLGDTFREMRGIAFDINAKMRMNVAYNADFVLSAVVGSLFTTGRMTISRLNLAGSVVMASNVDMNVGFLGAKATFTGTLQARTQWQDTANPIVITPGATAIAGLLAKVPAGTSLNMTVTVTPDTTLPGLAGLSSATMTLAPSITNTPDPFDATTYAFSKWELSSTMNDFLPFNEISAASVVSMLRSLSSTVQRLVNLEFNGYKIPFRGTGLESVLDFVSAFSGKLLDGDSITPRLLDEDGMLTFFSAQSLFNRLKSILGATNASGTYVAVDKELVYTIEFSGFQLTLLDLPINFRLDLGSLANVRSDTLVRIDSQLGMKIAFGFNLDPAASGTMTLDTALADLKRPPAGTTLPTYTGAQSVPAYYGRLSGDAVFQVTVEGTGAGTYSVTLTRAATKDITDTTPTTLVNRLKTALAAAGIPASVVDVQVFDYDNEDDDASMNAGEWRLKLVAGAGVTSVSISGAQGSVFTNELGFLFSDSGTEIKAQKTLDSVVGRFGVNTSLSIALSGSAPVGGIELTVTVLEEDARDNRTIADLVYDIKQALKASLAGTGIFSEAELAALNVDHFLRVSTQAGAAGSTTERLVLTAVDSRITGFAVGAQAALGFTASPLYPLSSNLNDFVIHLTNGTSYAISLSALPANPTIGNLRTLIQTATANKVLFHLTADETDNKPLWDGRRLILQDTTFAKALPGVFRIETVNGSRVAADLGILARDAIVTPERDERDGYIEGATVYGLSLTDRFFIRGMGGAGPDFFASLALRLVAPGLDASASIGFVTVRLLSVDASDKFQIGVGFDLKDPNGDGTLTLTELLAELASAASEERMPDLLSDVVFNGVDATDILRVRVVVTPTLGDFSLVDPTKHITFRLVTQMVGDIPILSISMEGMPALGDINEFLRTFGAQPDVTSFGFTEVLSALRSLTTFLSTFQSFGFLDQKIPLIGKSVSELVSIANQFNEALTALTRDPASALQAIKPVIRGALGVATWEFAATEVTANSFSVDGDQRDRFPVGYVVEIHKTAGPAIKVYGRVASATYSAGKTTVAVTGTDVVGVSKVVVDPISLSMVSGGTGGAKILRVDILMITSVSRGASLALPNLSIPGLGDAISLTGGAGLNLAATLVGRLAVGLDLGALGTAYLFDATSIKATLTATGANLSFTANLGPISLGVVGGTANLSASASVTLDPALFSGGKTSLTTEDDVDAILAGIKFVATGSATATLPVTLSGFALGTIGATASYSPVTGEWTVDVTLPDRLTDPSLIAELLQSLNFLDALALLPQGVDVFLDTLQGILGSDVLSISLPFIGDQLASAARFVDDVRRNFVAPLTEIIESLKNAAADFASQDKNQVSLAIYKLLGPSGLGLLRDRNGDNDVTVADILLSTNMPSPPSFGEAYAEWLMEIGGTYTISQGIDFDIGIPGLGLETTGAIALVIQWSLMLGFGISGNKGVYILLAPEGRAELALDVEVDFDGASITGKLAFLELSAVVKPETVFGATFAVDLALDGSSDTRVGITDLGDLSLELQMAVEAKAYLGLSLGINSDIGSIAAGFPKVVADFVFVYEFGDRGDGGIQNLLSERLKTWDPEDALSGDALWSEALERVALENIGLDLGSFLTQVVKPIVTEINKAIEPFMPIIKVATTPIPVISELSGEPVTLLTLAGIFGSFDAGMIESIADILKVINSLATMSGEELVIPFGDWVIYSKNPVSKPPIWDAGGKSLVTTPAKPWGDANFAAMLGSAQGSNNTRNAMANLSNTYGLSFPLFSKPTLIFELFMGKDVALVQYDLKPFKFEFSYEQFFPIIGPLGVAIGGSLGVEIDLGFGYSTRGIRLFVENDARNVALLLDGFYFMDLQGDPAEDVAELRFWGSITAAAQVNLVVAKAGVKGGIFVEIRFDLNDPDGDGMVHLSEMAGNVLNEWRFGEKALASLAIFDISGEIVVRLFAFIYVDLFFFSIDWEQDIVPPITILDFNFAFGRHPVWATEMPNGDLVLNIGPAAAQRLHGPLDGEAAETVTVTGTRSNLLVNGQPYKVGATGKIIAKGGGGDDVIDLSGVTDAVDCIIDGGAGNDTIKAPSGGGKAIIYGGTGDDTLEGGAGEDHIWGGPGSDTIRGNAGNDFLFGDSGALDRGGPGKKGTITVTVGATDGDDTIYGDDGRDFIFGGGGKDTVYGGAGNDVIFGDSGQVEFAHDTLALLHVEGTEAGKRGDADTLYGEDGDDYIFGGVGDDYIDGGSGRDFLFGESGRDRMFGGPGNDDMFGDGWIKLDDPPDPNHPYRPASGGDDDYMDGGSGDDRLWGGGGNDILKGGTGNDHLYGGPGNDILEGGSGDDYLYGQGDNDILYGGAGNDYLDGGLGDDIVWGANGPDDYTFGYEEMRLSAPIAGDRDTLVWSAGVDLMDGQSDSDEYIIDFSGGTSIGRVYLFDSGGHLDGIDRLKVNGTAWADVFLLRGVDDGDRGLGFVAMLNADPSKPANMQPVERADYSNIERLTVNGHLGNDRFFIDDVHAECTINGGAGEDVFQLGQMYRSERIYPNVSKGNRAFTIGGITFKEWVTPDYLAPVVEDPFPRDTVAHGDYDYPGGDQYMTIETTRGFLSRGVRFPITINGGPGNDFFTVFHNEAVANLNGEAGDDVFLIKAFALAGSQEPKRGRSDVSGGDGTDLVMYVVNAPVNIDGGDGFDRVIIVGTEFGDDIVITRDGVYGAGLNVNYVNIESLEIDGAEGDDRFFVQSTSEKFVTRISGGLGNDTFFMSGDVPPVISNDLLGHSGLITHNIEFGGGDGAGYVEGFKIEGISANVADDDEPGIRITETGGGTTVTEGSPDWDEYTIVLTKVPIGDVIVRALVPARSPTDEELNAVHFRVDSPDAYSVEADGSGVTFLFTPADWDTVRTVRVYADGLGDDQAYEGTRSGFINHTVVQPLGTYRGSVSSVELITIPDDTVEYDPKVRYETKLTLTHDTMLDGNPIPHPFVPGQLVAGLLEIVDGTGIGQRMLIAANDEHTVTVFGKFRREPDSTSKYLIRRYQELALPSVLVTVYDDDAADVAVYEIAPDNATDPLEIDGFTAVVEGGGPNSGTPDRIAVRLTKPLAAGETVVIGISNPDGQLVLSATELTFTSANWNQTQRVTVSANDDSIREGRHYGLILFTVLSGPGDVTASHTDHFEHTQTPEDWTYVEAYNDDHVFKPEAYVGLSFNPKGGVVKEVWTTEEGTERKLDPSEYYVEGNLVIFLDSAGDPRMVTGRIKVVFDYVKPGYKRAAPNELHIEPVLVEIADNEVPGVIIRETGGSTDVIETTAHWGDGEPWSDSYYISLATQPADDVWITVMPDFTKTTRGRIRHDLPQVIVTGGANTADKVNEWRHVQNIRGEWFWVWALKLKFTPANWDVPQEVIVNAVQDDVIDGGDTKVFAPKLHTVSGIQGPVFVEGAGGSGSLIDMSAQLLPGEKNKKEPSKPLQAYAVDPETGVVTATVLRADALELADITEDDILKLVKRTLEITAGAAIDQFRLITEVDIHPTDSGLLVLTLNEPYLLEPGEVIDTTDPENPTLYAVTRESLNFFVDETKSIDFMFVFDTDSVADSSGRIANLRTQDFPNNGTVAEFVTRLEAKRLTGLQMGQDLVIGGFLQPGGITYGDLEVVEINLGSGDNTFVIDNTHYRPDFQTWTMVNTGKGDDTVTISISRTRHVATAAAGSTANTLKLAGGAFAPGSLVGFLLEITSGDLKGTRRSVIGNTADTLTLSAPWEMGVGGVLLMPAAGDTCELWLEDGPLAVNGQQGDDVIDGSASTIPLVLFGSEGDDVLTGGSADDIIFGDLGRVDYYDEQGRLVTRLGVDRAEFTGHTAGAANVIGSPAPPEEWVATFTSKGTPFDAWMLDDLLVGCELQTVNGPGFGQFLFILSYTNDTLTVRGNFDPIPYEEGKESTWRIPILPENQTDGVVRAPTLVMSRDRSVGGRDVIYGLGGADLLIGGAESDTIFGDAFVEAADDGADVIFGDNGRMDFNLDADPFDGDPLTLDRAYTLDPAYGADDTIFGGGADDVIFGGTGGDWIVAGSGDDLVFGDFGDVWFGSVDVDMLGALAHRTQYPLYATVTDDALGGVDTIFGGHGEDVIVGGAYGDLLDGGADDDLIFGDNVVLDRRTTYNDFSNPRYRTASGALYDLRGDVLVGTMAQNIPSLTGTPVWGNWDFTLLYHDADHEAMPSSLFGDDYIAGGPHDDTIFGQLGNDTIQGDGSIAGKVMGGGVSAVRLPSGALSVVHSSDGDDDGDDYIEGGGGDDVIFGNLGQDDIIGGSSSLFSLDTRERRPDGADIIFGGSGTAIDRNTYGDPSHARDADTIAGDNANIYRIVSVAPSMIGAGTVSEYRTFSYDTYEGGLRLIPRAVELLDYTPGGPDYRPERWNPTDPRYLPDIGAGDEIHGESGDDTIYGMTGDDVIFGEAGDDDIIGGWGNDWISGGTGQDGVLGDDGRIYTSRNSATYDEPLYGIAALLASDPNPKASNGNVLNELIATPGNMQTAVINVAGELKKTVNLEPFNLDPTGASGGIQSPHFRPLYADDIIYGGLGSDFLHGGAGDDAISGAEALPAFYAAPHNPGDVLEYSKYKAGEFAAYDEYDPWAKIAGFLLNFDKTEGPELPGGTITKGVTYGPVNTDGDDVIFGDLGNDWLVGGTGRDTLYGGWGDDLLNADDDQDTNGGANNAPDTHPSYEDRAYGGAGRDVLIGNTGGDRLIDWVGEFNSYIVPFAPFGAATVSRTLQPQLHEFLYALSASHGADPTRAIDTGNAAVRNGEPDGELGLVLQKDAAWQDQTGAPADPQAGNIPGGARDVLRSASFNDGTAQGFSADSGTWTVSSGRLQVAPEKLGGEAVSVFYVDSYLPRYYEVQATINAVKPVGGYKANAYLIFDYHSPTDFKFVGVNISTDKLELGYRDANGWKVVAQTPAKLRPDTDYRVLLSVNGTYVTVVIDGKYSFAYTYAPHVDSDGFVTMLNTGMVGIGANNSKARIDNVAVQILPPAITHTLTVDFATDPAELFAAPVSGEWALAGNMATVAPNAGTTAIALARPTIDAAYLLQLETMVKTSGSAGFTFDYYDDDDYKFVTIDAATGSLVLGHVSRGRVKADATVALGISASKAYKLAVTLQGNVVQVFVDGRLVLTFAYNALVTDGRFGMIATGGAAAFDYFTFKTSDPEVVVAPAVGSFSPQLVP